MDTNVLLIMSAGSPLPIMCGERSTPVQASAREGAHMSNKKAAPSCHRGRFETNDVLIMSAGSAL